MRTKVCRTCGLEKSVSDFYREANKRSAFDAYRPDCKICFNDLAAIARRLKDTGWTRAQYAEAYLAQSGKCAICGEAPGIRQLAADYNHITDARRALLCSRCNLGLGYFRDRPDLLRTAAAYLEQY